MSIQQNQQFTQQAIGNYICNYGIIPSTQTGYDIFDFFKISESQYGLYLLDVAGNGQSSKIAAQQTDQLICSFLQSDQKSLYINNPEILMHQLNSKIYNLKLGKYLTLFYGVLDLTNNCFNYSIAGHYPNPILLDYKGFTKFLFGKGFPLGVLPNTLFEKFSTPIQINEAIIVFSNGIMKQYMPTEDMDHKSDYLLNITYNSKAKINNLLDQLNLNLQSNNIIDDIIIAVINRQA